MKIDVQTIEQGIESPGGGVSKESSSRINSTTSRAEKNSESEKESESENESCTESEAMDSDMHAKFPYEWNIFALSPSYHFVRRMFKGKDVVAYEAIDRADNVRVALKICDRYTRGRVPREIRILHAVQGHPNICNLRAWHILEKTDTCAVITEFIPNRGIPAEASINESRTQKQLIYDVVKGLQHLHAQGILYRDVKLSNVLWDHIRQRAVIIDYDIATLFQKDKLHRSIVGTCGFMAPELMMIEFAKRRKLALPFSGYGLEVDVYALGMVLGQLMMGCDEEDITDDENLECKGEAFLQLLGEIATKGLCTPGHVLLTRMLHPLPSERITLDELFRDPWFQELASSVE
jgi:serine/threonine protein kinase